MVNVVRELITWLWQHWLPFGKLVALVGDPAVGKSTLATTITATASAGGRWPTGERCEPMNVLYLSAEDGLGDTVRPRLEAAGPDLARVHVITHVRDETEGSERPLSIPEDVDRLEHVARNLGARLIVVDVLNSFLSGRTDSHKDASLRGALAPLAAMADRLDAVVLYLLHLNKSGGTSAMYRAAGSVAYVAAARVAIIAGLHPDPEQADTGQRVIAQVKNNLAPLAGSIGYHLVSAPPPLDCAAVEWSTGSMSLSADDLLRSITSEEADDRKEIDAAIESLFEGTTFVRADDALKQLSNTGFERNAVLRARKRLGIVTEKVSMDPKDGWVWRWPKEFTKTDQQPSRPTTVESEIAPMPPRSEMPVSPADDAEVERAWPELLGDLCDRCGEPAARRITHHETGAKWCSDCCEVATSATPALEHIEGDPS